jgi:hypothetical protein
LPTTFFSPEAWVPSLDEASEGRASEPGGPSGSMKPCSTPASKCEMETEELAREGEDDWKRISRSSEAGGVAGCASLTSASDKPDVWAFRRLSCVALVWCGLCSGSGGGGDTPKRAASTSRSRRSASLRSWLQRLQRSRALGETSES